MESRPPTRRGPRCAEYLAIDEVDMSADPAGWFKLAIAKVRLCLHLAGRSSSCIRQIRFRILYLNNLRTSSFCGLICIDR